MKKRDDIVLRDIHGTYFLIDITDAYSEDRCVIFELNDIGKFIWENINTDVTEDIIARNLEKAIVDDVDYMILLNDVKEFIQVLRNQNFIED